MIAANRMLAGKNHLAADFDAIKEALFNTAVLQTECDELQNEMAIVAEMIEKCVDDNAHRRQDQSEYNHRYGGLVERFEKAKSRFTELTGQIQECSVRRQAAESFLAVTLRRKTPLTGFDEQFWYATVETATVYNDGRVVFKFKDGIDIEG